MKNVPSTGNYGSSSVQRQACKGRYFWTLLDFLPTGTPPGSSVALIQVGFFSVIFVVDLQPCFQQYLHVLLFPSAPFPPAPLHLPCRSLWVTPQGRKLDPVRPPAVPTIARTPRHLKTPDRKSTRLNSSHLARSRMPSSA